MSTPLSSPISWLLLLITISGSFTSFSVADNSTLTGKVMCGYQGWFNCPEDGAELGWTHWARYRQREFGPGNVTVDLWPDVSELDADERYATGFRHADGRVAAVFSSGNRKTVIRHCRWMKDYGVDGVFLQRFASTLADAKQLRHRNQVLSHLRAGVKQHQRVYAMMYDLSGLGRGGTARVREDWSKLQAELRLTDDKEYLRHNGKPLVAIWGVGFNDDRRYTLAECEELVSWFRSNGYSVMLGVPTYWRDLRRDAVADERLHSIIRMVDVVSPWTVGRYQTPEQAERYAADVAKPDLNWCLHEGIDYLPVVFPGFSWHHLKGDSLDAIPRRRGKFLWSQIAAAKRIGCQMIYVAMFDEVDEATAIFKCTNDPPGGEDVEFLDYEGLPSDHYLRIVGHAAKLLRGETDAPPEVLP